MISRQTTNKILTEIDRVTIPIPDIFPESQSAFIHDDPCGSCGMTKLKTYKWIKVHTNGSVFTEFYCIDCYDTKQSINPNREYVFSELDRLSSDCAYCYMLCDRRYADKIDFYSQYYPSIDGEWILGPIHKDCIPLALKELDKCHIKIPNLDGWMDLLESEIHQP